MRKDVSYMRKLRFNRKALGLKQMTLFVPENEVNAVNLFVDRLQAERMLDIVQQGDMKLLRLVAARNLNSLPSIGDTNERFKGQQLKGDLKAALAEAVKYTEKFAAFYHTALESEDNEEMHIQLLSKAVAHNHMAHVLWREFEYDHEQMIAAAEKTPKEVVAK